MSISTSASSGVKDQLTSQAMPEINHALGSQIPSQLFEQAHTDQTQPVADCERTTFKCVKPWAPVQGHSFIRYMRLQSVTQDSLINALGIIGFEDGKIALTLSVHEYCKEKFESTFRLKTDEASLQAGVYVYAVHQESEIQNMLKHCDFPVEQRAFLKRLIVTENWKTARLKKKIDVIDRLHKLHLFCGNLKEAENYLNKRSEGYIFFPSSEDRKICGLIKWKGSPLIDLQYKIKLGGALKGRWDYHKTSIIKSDAHRTVHGMLRIFKNRIAENNARHAKLIKQLTKLGFYFSNQDEAELGLKPKSLGYVIHPSSQDDRFLSVIFKKRDGSISNDRFSLEPDGRFKLHDEFFYDLGDMLQRFASILAM